MRTHPDVGLVIGDLLQLARFWLCIYNSDWTTCIRTHTADYFKISLKPVTDEQVFYDKFSYDKFYLPNARVYMQHILYDKFYFTGVNVSTSLL